MLKNKIKASLIIIFLFAQASFASSSMKEIPQGSFKRSDGQEVNVGSFSLLSTEVTWSQFNAVKRWAEAKGYEFEGGIGQADLPAQNITWYDAVKWCNALSEMSGRTPTYTHNGQVYRRGRADLASADAAWKGDGFRLPTEAEWEYAYRAGTSTKFYWGDYARKKHDVNTQYAAYHYWGTDEIDGGPLPVASKKPNAFGLHDMAGNVEEWVWNRFSIKYRGVGIDNPKGPDEGMLRVMRGGGFVIDRVFSAASRHPSFPFCVNTDIGFRIASSDPKASAQALSGIKTEELSGNQVEPHSKPPAILDVRPDTDQKACERLARLFDMKREDLKAFSRACEAGDYSGALAVLRDLAGMQLKNSHLKPYQSHYVNKKSADRWLEISKKKEKRIWYGPGGLTPSAFSAWADPHLAKYYAKYGDEAYAEAYLSLANDYALTHKPVWNRLSVAEKGSRGAPRDNFYAYIGFDAGHPAIHLTHIAWMLQHGLEIKDIPPRTLANIIYSAVVDRASVGLQDARENVPNQIWGNAITLIELAEVLPQLKAAKELHDVGVHRFMTASGTVMEDGTDLEASLNYNKRLFEDQKKINAIYGNPENRPEWLKNFNRRADNRYYMYAGLATPHGTYPGIGNQNPSDLRARNYLKEYLKEGHLDKMAPQMNQLLKTEGAKAKAHPFTSMAFPYGGYYALRSGWSSDDLYLLMRSSRDGSGHTHPDNNNVQVSAYGAQLLVDRGSPAYFTGHLPDHQKKYKHYFGGHSIGSVFMANAVSVDGYVQGSPEKKLTSQFSGWQEPRKALQHLGSTFDFVEGNYAGDYHREKPISDKNMSDLIKDYGLEEMSETIAYNTRLKELGPDAIHVSHKRRVIFIKPEKFWIVVDKVDGEGSRYIQNWNFPAPDKGINQERYFLAPKNDKLYYGSGHSLGYTPNEVRFSKKDKRIYTISHHRPNIALLNFTGSRVDYVQQYGEKYPWRGWHSFGIVGEKVPAVSMECHWKGGAPMATVLFPSPSRGGKKQTILDKIKGFKAQNSEEASGFDYSSKKGRLCLRTSAKARSFSAFGIEAKAELFLAYKQKGGKLSGIILGCEGLKVDGKDKSLPSSALLFTKTEKSCVLTPILAPTAFKWTQNAKGQMLPAYQ